MIYTSIIFQYYEFTLKSIIVYAIYALHWYEKKRKKKNQVRLLAMCLVNIKMCTSIFFSFFSYHFAFFALARLSCFYIFIMKQSPSCIIINLRIDSEYNYTSSQICLLLQLSIFFFFKVFADASCIYLNETTRNAEDVVEWSGVMEGKEINDL